MSIYDEYGLELESENYGADPELNPHKKSKVIVKKKGGFLGKVISLLLGIVIGAGGVVGGVAGVGYYAVSTPVKDVMGTVGNLTGTNINYTEYISEEYAKGTVIDLVGETVKIAQNFAGGKGCLNDLVKISPFVGTAFDPLFKILKGYGLGIDKDKFLATPLGELPDFLTEEILSKKLIDILNAEECIKALPEDNLTQAILNDLCYDEEGNPATIGDLIGDGLTGITGTLALESLLLDLENGVDPKKDALLMAIAYGNANRYTVGSDNKVTMNTMQFKRVNNALYDIDGNLVDNAVLGSNDIFKITNGDEVYYAAPKATIVDYTAPIEYVGYKDEACSIEKKYSKVMLDALLGGNATDLFTTIELGSLFNVSPLQNYDADTTNNPDSLMLALAFGEEGVHYNVVENDGVYSIEWLNGNKPRTIGTLLGGELASVINEMRLATVLGISPLQNYDTDDTNDSDPLMLALAFGEEGIHYEIVENDGVYSIKWLNGNKPRTIADLRSPDSVRKIFNQIRIATALGVNHSSVPFMIALAYGSEGDGFVYETDAEGNKTGITPLKPPHTLADLTSTGENSIINTLKLKDFFGEDVISDDNSLLKHLSEETIGSLPKAIEKLTFKQVYPGQIYVSRYMAYVDVDDDGAIDAIKVTHDKTNGKYTDDNGNDYQSDKVVLEYKYLDSYGNEQWINSKNIYYCSTEHNYYDNPELTGEHLNLVLQPQWVYLLTEEDHVAHDYPLSDFNALVKNMMNNMKTATLGDLAKGGILSSEQLTDSTLGTEVRLDLFTDEDLEKMHIDRPAAGEKLYVSDLNITQMLNYSTALINKLPPAP